MFRKLAPSASTRTRPVPAFEALEDRAVPATFTVLNLADSGAGSLRDAVDDANQTADADVVTFAAGLSGSISLTGGEIEIYDSSLEIQGPGSSVITIDAGGNSRIFDVGGYVDVTISGLTLTGGATDGDGGAIRSSSNLTLVDSVVTGNAASENGGGIAVHGFYYFYGEGTLSERVDLRLQNVQVTGNTAGGNGGGVFGEDLYDASIEASLISGNASGGSGGEEGDGGGGGVFIYNLYSGAIRDSVISENVTQGDGGGVYLYGNGTTFVIANSTFAGNDADGRGGALFLGDDDVGGEGGSYGPAFIITASTLSGNTADGGGGAVHAGRGALDSYLLIENSTISGNVAPAGTGGAVYMAPRDSGSIIRNSTIVGNEGGGIVLYASGYQQFYGDLTIISTIVHGNSGGDLASDGTTINAENSIFGELPPGVVNGTDVANLVGVDPLLGALADNGGPTLTHLPQFGSPVFDVGSNPAGLQTDQRGDPRLLGNGVDIGAVESEPMLPVDPPPGPGPEPEPEPEGDELPPFWVASGAPAGVGLPDPADDADQAFVRSLYRGILGREVDAAGFESWVNDLRSGASREDVVNGFLRSREYRLRAVENMFQVFLERSASEVELALYVAALDDGSSLEDLAADILASDEYALAHPTSADFVAGLYEDILLREPDAGADAYIAQLDAGEITRLDLATVFVKSGDSSTVEFFNISLRYFGDFPDGLPPSGDALDLAFVLLT